MNPLRDLSVWRLWRRLVARRRGTQPVYAITVPAPLATAEVVELRRPVVVTQPAPLPRVVNG